MNKFQNLYCLIVIFLLVSAGFAQNQTGDAQWIQVKDDKLEFSISFPPNYLVDNEIEKSYILAPILGSMPQVINSFEKPRIIANQRSVRMRLSVYQLRPVSDAKNYLWYFLGQDNLKDNYQDFRIGDFVGRTTTFDTDKTMARNVAIAVKNRVYLISAFAKNEDKKIYEKFVTSLMLNGKLLFKSQPTAPADTSPSVLISTLQTSPEILAALNQKQEESEIKVVKSSAPQPDENKEERNYSRPLILLRQPLPAFPNPAKGDNSAGHIRLKVTFLASGKIANIVVLSEQPDNLTESAIKAAQKIKFLPAEIDGKKVDATETLVYIFNAR